MFVCSQLQGLQIFQHSLVRRTVEQIARLEYDSVSTEVEGLAPHRLKRFGLAADGLMLSDNPPKNIVIGAIAVVIAILNMFSWITGAWVY